jgi:hypothetical protein
MKEQQQLFVLRYGQASAQQRRHQPRQIEAGNL